MTRLHYDGNLFGFIFLMSTMLFAGTNVMSQSTINIGFENGSFLNWQGGTGQCCPISTPVNGIVVGRHTISSGNATDPSTGGIVSITHPESQFSCKLGNETGNSESESLFTTFIIPSDSLSLVIRYAVVLQNAQHPASKQPRFSYEITTNGNIPEGCLQRTITAGDTSISFEHFADIDFLNWQTSVINLSGKQGDVLSVRFETGDCEPGGHFGLAYVDLNLVPVQFHFSGCDSSGNWFVIAPAGLPGIWGNGSANDTLQISGSAVAGDVSYLVNSNTACEFVLQAKAGDLFPSALFTTDQHCNQELSLSATGDSIASANWFTGDGTVLHGLNVNHHYSASGLYEVSLTVTGSNNCQSTATQEVYILDSPEVNFTADTGCTSFPVLFHQHSKHCDWLNWYADGTLIESGLSETMTYYGEGQHEFTLIGGNNQSCTDTLSKNIWIPSEADCFQDGPIQFAPNCFTPNGDGINDFYTLSGLFPYSVYNRMGQLLYQGNRWDGKFEHTDVQQGIYVIVIAEDLKPKQRRPITVSLIR